MTNLFSLHFTFEEAEYACLVRMRVADDYKMYKITVMNGELERLLYADNVIIEKDHLLEMPSVIDSRLDKLRFEITKSLQEHLQSNPILSESFPTSNRTHKS